MKRNLAAVVTLGVLLAGCGAADAGDGAQKTITVASAAQPPNLDPHLSASSTTTGLSRPVFETLLSMDADRKPQPMLAESYERSPDGLKYTFKLRKGLKFQDGSDLDADDVVASMQRWSRLAPPVRDDFKDSTWTKVDPLTVALQVPKASFLHLLHLSSRFANYPAIMPKEIIDKAGDDPVKDIVGTGPYRFVEWKADQELTLEKWSGYQALPGERSGSVGNKTGKLDKIVFQFVADASTRTLGLKSGQYDITMDAPYDSLDELYDDPALKVGSYNSSPLNLVFSGRQGTPAANAAMRQAIHTALNRDEIMIAAVGRKELYDLSQHNMAKAQESMWNTEVGRSTFNKPDAAKVSALLKETGYNGESLVLTVTRDYTEAYNAAVVVQSQLQKVGIKVELQTREWASYFQQFLSEQTTWDMSVFPQVLQLDPSQTVGFSKSRPGYWASPRLDDLLARYRSAPTLKDATAMYDEMQRYIEDTRPLSRLGDNHGVYAATTRLRDVPTFDGAAVWWAVEFGE
ncbi:ABC transporter substrate-binding protein [Lentzea sp. JNUCC 0626]|uniref:ABC transporter substrate-binding protein n=1 Tax=Lentzea sp. JNUCC 0626 TaxID=3367513 RepID=UPI00374A7F78